MRISCRALVQRLVTYPLRLPIMPLYKLAENKRPVLDVFYLFRGTPHGYLKDATRIARYEGLCMAFPFNEDPSFDDVWLRNVYYPYGPQRDHVVVDVGAHVGSFTLKIARSVHKVVAIEPDPSNFCFLKSNVVLNRLEDKISCYNLALGERNGKAFLDRSGYGYGRSKTTTVKSQCPTIVRKLDAFVEELEPDRLDLVKVDTEGSEIDILKGAERTLREYRPKLLLAAYHFANEHLMLARQLRKHEYRVCYYEVPFFLSTHKEPYLFSESKQSVLGDQIR